MRAAFKAVMDGKQEAVLVPPILCQQHYQTFPSALVVIRYQGHDRFRARTEETAGLGWRLGGSGHRDPPAYLPGYCL